MLFSGRWIGPCRGSLGFRVRIRKGAFWCYFEPNEKPGPFVRRDIANPCQPIREKWDNDWLIPVLLL